MSQNTHTGVSPKRRPINNSNVKKRVEETAKTLEFLHGEVKETAKKKPAAKKPAAKKETATKKPAAKKTTTAAKKPAAKKPAAKKADEAK